jgi:hypothetical protein
MAKKKMRSMLSQQRAKLKAQKAAKAAKQAKAPKLPPGKKGGPIVKSKGGALAKTGKSAPKATPKALTGKPTPKALPAGKAGGALAKVGKGKGSVLTAITVGAALGDAYKRTNRAKAVSGRGAGRATFNEKKKKMSSIPPSEGTGGKAEKTLRYGSAKPKAKPSGTKSPKSTAKPATGASRRPSASSKPSAKVTRDTSKDTSRKQASIDKYGSGSKKGVTRNTSKDTKTSTPKAKAKPKMSRNKRNLLRRQGRL